MQKKNDSYVNTIFRIINQSVSEVSKNLSTMLMSPKSQALQIYLRRIHSVKLTVSHLIHKTLLTRSDTNGSYTLHGAETQPEGTSNDSDICDFSKISGYNGGL